MKRRTPLFFQLARQSDFDLPAFAQALSLFGASAKVVDLKEVLVDRRE